MLKIFTPRCLRKLRHLALVPCLWFTLLPDTLQAQTPLADTTIVAKPPVVAIAPADTIPNQANAKFFKRAVIPSAVLIGLGIYTIRGNGIYSSYDARNDAQKAFPNFSTTIDDYLFFVPIAGLYGFNLFSDQNRHDIRRQTGLVLASALLTTALVYPTKIWTGVERPNDEPMAFPSGHTAYAFTIAAIVDKEFRNKSKWIGIGSYTIASATGVLRVLNNEHWMSDVLAGAGVGILSVNAVYWIHDKLAKNHKLNSSVYPTVFPTGQKGMGFALKF